ILDPVKKTATKMVRPNFQGGPGRGGPGGPGRGPGPGGPGGPPPNVDRNGSRRHDAANESLGQKTINSVLADGTRVTRTIPAGRVGNQAPIQVTSERWYSSQLKLNLLVKNNDPQHGQNTTTVSNINVSEPDASLFQVPADYTVKETGRGRGGDRGSRR